MSNTVPTHKSWVIYDTGNRNIAMEPVLFYDEMCKPVTASVLIDYRTSTLPALYFVVCETADQAAHAMRLFAAGHHECPSSFGWMVGGGARVTYNHTPNCTMGLGQ